MNIERRSFRLEDVPVCTDVKVVSEQEIGAISTAMEVVLRSDAHAITKKADKASENFGREIPFTRIRGRRAPSAR